MGKISGYSQDTSPTINDTVLGNSSAPATSRFKLSDLISLFFNNIPTAIIGAASINFGGAGSGVWWEEIGRATLGTAGNTIAISSFAAKKYLRILINLAGTGGTVSVSIVFNGDTASNYAYTIASANNGADSSTTSSNNLLLTGATTMTAFSMNLEGINSSSIEKVFWGERNVVGATGAGTAPTHNQYTGKWANSAAQITSLSVTNTSTGNFAIGSEVIVIGHN